MKRIGLLPNVEKDIGLVNTAMILDWLEKKNCTINLLEVPAQLLQRSDLAKNENQLYRDSDFIVVLGGDGTFLGAARNAALYDTPILGINLGTLGFLAEVEKRSSLEALQKVLNGEYNIEKRMMLEASVYDCHNDERKFICLNDIGITRGSLSRIIDLKIFINDNFVDDYPADGIIISTPTGSTAYSLSAGGPIINPTMELLLLNPICPHSLRSRPIILSKDEIIKIEGGMPRIISDEIWERVQERMSKNKKGANSAKEIYFLTGLIYCGKCNGAMTGTRKYAGRNKDLYISYECSTRKRTKKCDMKGLSPHGESGLKLTYT